MKVLITGATGLLGGHLLQALQQRGEQIRALVLPSENAEKLTVQGVEVIRGDVTDAGTLAPAVKGIEIIIHLAGMMGVERPLADYRLVNVTGSGNLYQAAQSVEKARSELGFEPQVDIREGIKLAAAWFNAGGTEQPVIAQASQYASLGGNRKQ